MNVFLIGASHKTMPLEQREALSLSTCTQSSLLTKWHQHWPDAQWILLSTCNRTEILAISPQGTPLCQKDMYACLQQLSKQPITSDMCYYRENEQAIAHLLRVGMGLESMVVGEPQIMGQIRNAYQLSISASAGGRLLNVLCQRALAFCKRTRLSVGIDAGRTSVASIAVDLAARIHGDLRNCTCLILGAGETGEVALRHLKAQNMQHFCIANRTLSHARELAETLDIDPKNTCTLRDVNNKIAWADIVISATASPHPILTRTMLKKSGKERRNRKQVVLDLAVPRDVEAQAQSIGHIYLYTVDDLQKIAEQTTQERLEIGDDIALELAEQSRQLYRRLQHLELTPTINRWRDKLEDVSGPEQERLLRTLQQQPNASPEALQKIIAEHHRKLLNKIMHPGVHYLNPRNHKEDPYQRAENLSAMFDIWPESQHD